jgi:hypothetical protein
MPLASKADRLPPPLREALARLWFDRQYSLDQLLEHLNALARGERSSLPVELAGAPAIPPEAIPGRSGLHDHFAKVKKAAERVRRSQMAAEALAREVGDAGEDKLARANFQMLHTAVHEIFMAAEGGEDDGDGDRPALDPKSAMMLSITLEKLEAAKKKNADLRVQIRKEVAEEAAGAVEAVARKGGVTPQALAAIREALGIA